MANSATNSSARLTSLDVMRGLIMILLAGESCLVYTSLKSIYPAGFSGRLVDQFFHHPWHGLHFWDLVQPAFMTMAGTAMYLAYQSKLSKGISWNSNLKHILTRSLKLFLLGTSLHCIYAGKMVWELWNVLTQLSVTTLVAYLIINRSVWFQLAFTVMLLLATEILYRCILMPGFDQPFVESHNFGSYVDVLLMGKINADGWVAINIIPTAAHTIWGMLAGKLLISKLSTAKKIGYLVLTGLTGLIIGFGLDLLYLTPIIKRISTSSFTLASGGWVMLFLAFFYWLVDVKQVSKYAWIFTVVGMNAVFIYLFFETVGSQWFNGIVAIFIRGTLGFTALPDKGIAVFSAITTLIIEWYLCFWLSKRKIYVKI